MFNPFLNQNERGIQPFLLPKTFIAKLKKNLCYQESGDYNFNASKITEIDWALGISQNTRIQSLLLRLTDVEKHTYH